MIDNLDRAIVLRRRNIIVLTTLGCLTMYTAVTIEFVHVIRLYGLPSWYPLYLTVVFGGLFVWPWRARKPLVPRGSRDLMKSKRPETESARENHRRVTDISEEVAKHLGYSPTLVKVVFTWLIRPRLEDSDILAMVTGPRSDRIIAVGRGAIRQSDAALKAVIGHEYGHIAPTLEWCAHLYDGASRFCVLFGGASAMLGLLHTDSHSTLGSVFLASVWPVLWIAFTWFNTFALKSLLHRQHEYYCDLVGAKVGGAKEMIIALTNTHSYLYRRLSVASRLKPKKNASHPQTWKKFAGRVFKIRLKVTALPIHPSYEKRVRTLAQFVC